MREVFHKALQSMDGVMGKVVSNMAAGDKLSEDEALTRYVLLHRGNPRAIATFAAEQRPAHGQNPLQAAHEYETQMEAALKARR